MSKELEMYLTGKVMQFKSDGSSEESCHNVVLVDVTDTDSGELELGFDCLNPKRRTYLRVNAAELRRVLKLVQP